MTDKPQLVYGKDYRLSDEAVHETLAAYQANVARLQSINAQLVDALRWVVSAYPEDTAAIRNAHAAIARATEEQ
jgi:hypothetical protein